MIDVDGVNDGVTEGDNPGVTLTLGVGEGVVVFVAKNPNCTAPIGILIIYLKKGNHL